MSAGNLTALLEMLSASLCRPFGKTLVGRLPQSGWDLGAELEKRAGVILPSQPRHLSITSRRSDSGGKPTSLLQPRPPGSGSAEAQLLLNHFAGILAQNSPADHAL